MRRIVIIAAFIFILLCGTLIYMIEKNRPDPTIQSEENTRCDCISRSYYHGYHTVPPYCHKYLQEPYAGGCFI